MDESVPRPGMVVASSVVEDLEDEDAAFTGVGGSAMHGREDIADGGEEVEEGGMMEEESEDDMDDEEGIDEEEGGEEGGEEDEEEVEEMERGGVDDVGDGEGSGERNEEDEDEMQEPDGGLMEEVEMVGDEMELGEGGSEHEPVAGEDMAMIQHGGDAMGTKETTQDELVGARTGAMGTAEMGQSPIEPEDDALLGQSTKDVGLDASGMAMGPIDYMSGGEGMASTSKDAEAEAAADEALGATVEGERFLAVAQETDMDRMNYDSSAAGDMRDTAMTVGTDAVTASMIEKESAAAVKSSEMMPPMPTTAPDMGSIEKKVDNMNDVDLVEVDPVVKRLATMAALPESGEDSEETLVKTEFVWADGAENDVKLSGSWNGWMPVQMFHEGDGLWSVITPVPIGPHEFKFIVDGEWCLSTRHPTVWEGDEKNNIRLIRAPTKYTAPEKRPEMEPATAVLSRKGNACCTIS
mmetsp:Transcript_14998/g.30489  ORF Transcript_14998/g.30489 Transcript_14998/m.30489 type:complete len:466 (-) Transcript_14998:1470-2867(-)